MRWACPSATFTCKPWRVQSSRRIRGAVSPRYLLRRTRPHRMTLNEEIDARGHSPRCFVSAPRRRPGDDKAPVRGELFGVERLSSMRKASAAAQSVTARPPKVPTLQSRLKDNARSRCAPTGPVRPNWRKGAAWCPPQSELLDNSPPRRSAGPGDSRCLAAGLLSPTAKAEHGPFAGYPRVSWHCLSVCGPHRQPCRCRWRCGASSPPISA